jgi:hypothetical protein
MNLKQFLSNIQSGTERFYTLSASSVHRLSKFSADPYSRLSFREFHEFHGFHEFEASETTSKGNCHGTPHGSTSLRVLYGPYGSKIDFID